MLSSLRENTGAIMEQSPHKNVISPSTLGICEITAQPIHSWIFAGAARRALIELPLSFNKNYNFQNTDFFILVTKSKNN